MNTKYNIQQAIKILMVEDNPGDVVIVREYLKFSGINFDLIHSPTLRDALSQTKQKNFDVILLDLGLPDSLGLETLKKLHLSTLKAPVIVMTGLDDEDTALSSLKEGAQDYLFKNNLSSQNIVHSIRYSIERKKIQEIQKKNTLQFSILASATASINESEEVDAIYEICGNNISDLLTETNVFTVDNIDQVNPPARYLEWFNSIGETSNRYVSSISIQLFYFIRDLMLKSSDGKIIEMSEDLYEILGRKFDEDLVERIQNKLGLDNIYILGFSRNNKKYGGIFIFSAKRIDSGEISLVEILGNQASLSIHRRRIEKELILSEQRYKVLNKELEQRVSARTKELARANSLLEEELDVRIRLEQELIKSKNELEIRVQERTAELARSEERFHNMFYNHEAVMLLVHPETGNIVEANISARNFYGHAFNTESKNIFDLNVLSKTEIEENILKAIDRKNNYFVLPHKLASGETRIVEVYSSPIEMTGGQLLFSIIHDITERSRIEAALKESEALYKALVNNSLNIIIITVDQNIEFANDAALSFTHSTPENIVGKGIDVVFSNFLSGMEGPSLTDSIPASVGQNRAVEIQLNSKTGAETNYFLVRSNTIQYKGKEAIMSIFTDITENKNIEKYVLRRVIETEENDRKQFAADLHDDLGPILSTIKLRLDLMENMKQSEELKENITISNELTGIVIDKIRTISHNITPHLIETLGLDAGVRDLCKKIRELNRIGIVLESDIESKRYQQIVELHYYRIISELINNSLKHSQATNINIYLSGKDNKLELIYFDNGIGYNYSEGLQKSGGIGLRNILNRVTLINGTINFQMIDGKTVVKITKRTEAVPSVIIN